MAAKFESYWEGYNSGLTHTINEYSAAKSAWEAATELAVKNLTAANKPNTPCRFHMLHSSYKAGGQDWCGYCGVKL